MSAAPISPGELFAAMPRSQSREEIAAERIANRVMKKVTGGPAPYKFEVKGGLLGIFGTTHEPEVYAEAGTQLAQQGVEIEVHKMTQNVTLTDGESGVPLGNIPQRYDMIEIVSVNGRTADGATHLEDEPNHVERIYPPPADIDGMHNLSLHQQ